MNHERLVPANEVARNVAGHLAGFALDTAPLPSEHELAALVEAMFFASLHEEEGRWSAFNIAWQPAGQDCASVVAIVPSVPATPRNLAKLAPSTRHEATSIAVRPGESGLVAWALLEQNATEAMPLIIRALGSGVLQIDYAGVPRALYSRGQLFLVGGTSEVKSPARLLTQTFGSWRDAAADGIDLRAAVITRIAARALAHSHGGMILIVPAEVASPVGVRVHYHVGDGHDVLVRRFDTVMRGIASPDRLERLRNSRARRRDGRIAVRDEAQIAFAEAVELVARLTAVDNAVLLDTSLRLRGFGVQVLEGDTPPMEFEHSDPYSSERHVDDLATFKGTRHPAGVIFCMRQPREAAAIIASQDGQLSLAIKGHGGVEVVGSYERAFGWDR